MPFTLISTAFSAGSNIPAIYTCNGANVSHPLSWRNVPHSTKSLALIVDDPDAPDPAAQQRTWAVGSSWKNSSVMRTKSDVMAGADHWLHQALHHRVAGLASTGLNKEWNTDNRQRRTTLPGAGRRPP
jgi:phosphatidylethanolamine-binding protein (PEBP) family uncharacterized protein